MPDHLAARLAAASERQQVPPAQIVREALAKALPAPMPATDEPTLYELMQDGFGCVSSGLGDLATSPKYLEGYGRAAEHDAPGLDPWSRCSTAAMHTTKPGRNAQDARGAPAAADL